jgi:hypothetical protein
LAAFTVAGVLADFAAADSEAVASAADFVAAVLAVQDLEAGLGVEVSARAVSAVAADLEVSASAEAGWGAVDSAAANLAEAALEVAASLAAPVSAAAV